MKKYAASFLAIFYWLVSYSCFGQEKINANQKLNVNQDTTSLSFNEMSLEQLMSVKISVTSRSELTVRESPGIVTLITEDEIRNSGAQDITDVLKLVPGFDFGCDVQGVVGLGVRGNWAHEGKVLMLIDGQEMNELLYSTLQFGNHYSLEQISRIEIIRGPGSSIYGGNAEYAVINIITKNNKEFTGFSAQGTYGQMSESFSKRKLSLSVGKHFGDLALNIGALIGEGNRTQEDYTDYLGQTTNLKNKQRLNPSFAEITASYKGFSLLAIADIYNTTSVDGYDHLLSQPYSNNFASYYFEAKYKFIVNKKLSFTPRFNFKRQTPWWFKGNAVDDELLEFDVTASHPSYNLTGNYDLNKHISINGGGEYSTDIATNKIQGEAFNSGDQIVKYQNIDFFSQVLWSSKIANLTLGARIHDNPEYNPSFVPRFAITKVIKKFHAKLLFSNAYRTPSIENINYGQNIKPEKTSVTEFEAGYQFSRTMFISANLYDITTHDPIVYYVNNNDDAYINLPKSGTRGLEIDFKIKGKSNYADINYSFYTTLGKSVIDNYSVDNDEVESASNMALAFPSHKINASGNVKLSNHINLNGSVLWRSSRYAFSGIDSLTSNNLTVKYDPQVFVNLYFNFKDVLCKGLSAGIGCNNLFNEKELFIQPYNSYHNPLPGLSREFRFRISYDLSFSKKVKS